MINSIDFEPEVESLIPKTYRLLQTANLTVHPSVARIILHGSRGLTGNYRPNSDIDLSLIVDIPSQTDLIDLEQLLSLVYETTQKAWTADFEADLAIVFDTRNCGLKCFYEPSWHEGLCPNGGTDCFGLFKVQKGFKGLVTNAGIQVNRMIPCLQIWRRDKNKNACF
jgi:hypothetical protein